MQGKSLIINIHRVFDELGYKLYDINDFDAHELFLCFVKTLNMCKSIDDAFTCIELINLVLSNLDNIKESIDHYAEIFESLRYNGNKLLHLTNNSNSVYLTDAFFSDQKEVALTGQRFDNDIFYYDYIDESYTLKFTNYTSPYKTRYLSNDLTKIEIVDLSNKHVTFVCLSDNYFSYLEDNLSNLELVPTKLGVDVYYKEYTSLIKNKNKLDKEERIAYFYWDTISEESLYSLARIEIYKELDDDTEMLLYLLALANMRLFTRFMEACKNKNTMEAHGGGKDGLIR